MCIRDRWMTVRGARENNLRNIDVRFPLGVLTCVTGVSGSGKSSLVNEILYKTLAKTLNRARTIPGKHRTIEGMEQLDKVICIDQSPIGRTPRSNPATYTLSLIHILNPCTVDFPPSLIQYLQVSRFSELMMVPCGFGVSPISNRSRIRSAR